MFATGGNPPGDQSAMSRSGGNGNELMAMLVARLMEQRGRGWPVMRREMREFNGTEPEIVQDESGKFVRVTFRKGSI